VRIRVLAVAMPVVALLILAAPAQAFIAHLHALGHHPTECEKWPIRVSAHTRSGKPLRATALYHYLYNGQVVGTASPYGRNSTKPYPFKGHFRDVLRFPTESVGISLVFRVVIATKHHGKEHIDYPIKVRSGPRECHFT
jgi:hypothetical protein